MLKATAQFLSVVFHPLFVLTYMLLMLLIVNPYMFGFSAIREADMLLIMVFMPTAFIPLVAVLVMKGLGLVRSLQLEDKQERIGPYIVTGIMYLALYMQFVKANNAPQAVMVCTLGATIALFMAFFVNNFRKVSMHAVAMGGIVSMMILTKLFYSPDVFTLTLPLIGRMQLDSMLMLYSVILIAGAVCTARLLLRRHDLPEVYGGFLIGFFAQLIAYLVLI